MNEHEKDTRFEAQDDALAPVGATGPWTPATGRDLVLDLGGIRELDAPNLSLLLTAQQQAQKEDRVIWLAGISLQVWESLHAMGLGRFFRPFPTSRKFDN